MENQVQELHRMDGLEAYMCETQIPGRGMQTLTSAASQRFIREFPLLKFCDNMGAGLQKSMVMSTKVYTGEF